MININKTTGIVGDIEFIASPNFNQRPDPNDISLLVIHNISLPPGEFTNSYIQAFFTNQLPIDAHPYFLTIADLRVSSHVVIGRDGTMTQFVPLHERAWHAGESIFAGRSSCNDFSIGIELEGSDDLPYETAQYQSLIDLTKSLLQAYPMLNVDRIVGHCDIAPGRKTDPGSSFDWDLYKRALV